MKRILQITSLLLAALALSACDTLNDLVRVPPSDYTGTYADLDVKYNNVCGVPREGEVHVTINTEIVENASVHSIDLTAVIYNAGADGETITSRAQWSVNGAAKNLNSGAIDDFGTVNLKKDGDRFAGTLNIFNVECIIPAPDPSEPDQTTYSRISVPFTATSQ